MLFLYVAISFSVMSLLSEEPPVTFLIRQICRQQIPSIFVRLIKPSFPLYFSRIISQSVEFSVAMLSSQYFVYFTPLLQACRVSENWGVIPISLLLVFPLRLLCVSEFLDFPFCAFSPCFLCCSVWEVSLSISSGAEVLSSVVPTPLRGPAKAFFLLAIVSLISSMSFRFLTESPCFCYGSLLFVQIGYCFH